MISAAVMAGGQSRRMGKDKAWIELDGRPLIARVIDVLREVADEVFIVANEERYRTLGLKVVPDRYPDGGALGGIATGVGAAAHERVLVAACDMPFLRPEVWRLLIAQAEGADAVVPQIGGEYETLHALYSKACLAAMERALGSGRRRVISFFPDVRVHAVAEPALRAVDPGLRSFTNVNTPEELAAALHRRPSERAQGLAAAVAAATERVLARVHDLSPGAWQARCEAEGWSVGFETWHIARALERQRSWLEASLRGEAPVDFDWDATHALNAETSAAYGDPERGATVALLRDELVRAVALIGSLTDSDLDRDSLVSDGRAVSAKVLIGRVMVRHITGHLDSIEKALAAG